MKKLPKVLSDTLATDLESKGFRRRAEGIFTRESRDGFIGWLGLNTAGSSQIIEVNPVIGIRCQELERMLATILQERPQKYVPPTVSISLGYLMPSQSYRAWSFDGDCGNAVLSDLSDAICCYGIPFIELNSEISRISSLLELPKFGHYEHVMYRRPLARWLLGDAKGAIQVCESYCQALGQRVDMAAEHYRHFALGFELFVGQSIDTKPDAML